MATRTCFGGSGVIFSAEKFCSFSKKKVCSLLFLFGTGSGVWEKVRETPELTKNTKIRLLQIVISGCFKFRTNSGPQNRFVTKLNGTVGRHWNVLEFQSVNFSFGRHQSLRVVKKSQKRYYPFLIRTRYHWPLFKFKDRTTTSWD